MFKCMFSIINKLRNKYQHMKIVYKLTSDMKNYSRRTKRFGSR